MLRKTKDTELPAKSEETTPSRVLARRDPDTWFEEMNRWFDDFRRDFEDRFWGPLWPATPEMRMRVRQPLVDLADMGREFVVRAELPGVNREDLDIRVTEDGIELKAESETQKDEKEKDYYYRERSYASFHRVLPFPEEVLADRAEAKLKDGVLEIRVPKKEPTAKREAVRVRVE